MSISAVIEMSHKYGGGQYVLGGGGNTSVKEGAALHVKASGTELGSITRDGFVALGLDALRKILSNEYPQDDKAREAAALKDILAARLPGMEGKRPSVEAILHAIFPHKYVLHVHPALVNGLSCSQEGEAACERLFGSSVLWLPLIKPGYVLAAACRDAFAEYEREHGAPPVTVILQNHGIFVSADTPEEIDALMENVMAPLAEAASAPDLSETHFDGSLAQKAAETLKNLYTQSERSETAHAVFCANKLTERFVRSAQTFAPLIEPFTPDHIVYCRDNPLFIEAGGDYEAKFAAFTYKKGEPPKIVAVEGLGFFALGKSEREACLASALFIDAMKIAAYSDAFGGPKSLPREFTGFILNWEAESYRKKASDVG